MFAMAMAGCAAEDLAPDDLPRGDQDKESPEELPAALADNGKADSPWYPNDGGTMVVGQQVIADFNSDLGWIGYEAELTGGTVDIDIVEEGKGTDATLDTILILYGPRRSNGSYPTRAAAFNDDFVPGENLNSHIVFEVEQGGTYRIVTSTYRNWVNYPYNVSEGTYVLTMKCQNGLGACGPAL